MANIYVRSTDGNNADSGATWALAKLDGGGAAAIDAAGDTIYFSQNHAESTAAAISWSWAGTDAAPTRVLCGNDGAEPPTALATTGTVTTTGDASSIAISAVAGTAYVYGLTFIACVGSAAAGGVISLVAASGRITTEKCSFQIGTSNSSGSVMVAPVSTNTTNTHIIDCTFKFNNAGHSIIVRQGNIHIKGGSFLAGGVSPTNVFGASNSGSLLVEDFDLSNLDAAVNLFQTASDMNCTIRNCKLPASWSGALSSGTFTRTSGRHVLNNTDSSGTNYRLWVKDFLGDITHETTVIRTGGANDGTTGIAWKFVSTANPSWHHPFVSTEIVQWNSTTGASKTATVEIVHDSVTNLKDSEVWLEVQYLSASGTPLGTFINDGSADILATGADQTASTATWTTTGMTNPNKQKLAVTFTPQMAGFIHAKVMVAKASYTLYVDPKITVT